MERATGVAQWFIDDGEATSKHLLTHGSLFQTHQLLVPSSVGNPSEEIWSCSKMEQDIISDSIGVFSLPNLAYAEMFKASWVFNPHNASITTLELRFIVG